MKECAALFNALQNRDPRAIARAISIVENNEDGADFILSSLDKKLFDQTSILGITGSPGVGKSTLTSGLIKHYRSLGKRVGVVAVDPSSPLSGGALLGDRVRMMGHSLDSDVVLRSMATRGRLGGLCASAGAAVRIMAASGCSHVIIETVGVGQSEMDIIRLADITLMVLAPGLGDEIQAMKAGLLEVSDILVINKADCPGTETLTMEMEGAVNAGNNDTSRQKHVCQTVATEGKGIEELATTLSDLDVYLRQSGNFKKRRDASRELEIIDWALEFIKPQLLKELHRNYTTLPAEPRQAAAALIKKAYNHE